MENISNSDAFTIILALLVLFFMVLFIFRELWVINLPWENFKSLLVLLLSFLTTNIVLVALLFFSIVFTQYRVISYIDSSNIDLDLNTVLAIVQSKNLYEHLTYFAALAALFVYLNDKYEVIRFPYLKKVKARKQIEKRNKRTRSKYLSLKEDIRLRLILLESYKNKEELKTLDEQIKFEVDSKKFSDKHKQNLEIAFEKIQREYGEFKAGDIVVSTSNRLLRVTQDLSIERAEELLKTGYLKEFFPSDSSVDLKSVSLRKKT